MCEPDAIADVRAGMPFKGLQCALFPMSASERGVRKKNIEI